MPTIKYSKIILILLYSVIPAGAYSMFEPDFMPEHVLFRADLEIIRNLDYLNFFESGVSYYESTYKPENKDNERNLIEWQKQFRQAPALGDIDFILNETDPVIYINACEEGTLCKVFADNSFVRELCKPSNKPLGDYLLWAKKLEYMDAGTNTGFESWDYLPYTYNYGADNSDTKTTDVLLQLRMKADSILDTPVNTFLTERYAYQMCRLSYMRKDYIKCVDVYEQFFRKPDRSNLMNTWSLLFYALSLDAFGVLDKSNYYYSLVFDYCDSKKPRASGMYNRTDNVIRESLRFAANDSEKANIYALQCLNYYGRIDDKLNAILKYNPGCNYMPMIIQREINKLENFIVFGSWFDWLNVRNKQSDLAYLTKLKGIINNFEKHSEGEVKAFYNLASAQLCLIEDNPGEASTYLARVGRNYQRLNEQYETTRLWMKVREGDIHSQEFKLALMNQVEKLKKDGDKANVAVSLLSQCIDGYDRLKDIPTAGLLSNKVYRMDPDTGRVAGKQFKELEYFDNNASLDDISKVVDLLEKKKKSGYEVWLCRGVHTDFIRDLKGTVAFRQDRLDIAYQTFQSINRNFWQEYYYYSDFLNENPFEISHFYDTCFVRKFDYAFNKTVFVKQLLELKDSVIQRPADSCRFYLLLGNAYLNCTYYGNSWMMNRYSQSKGDKTDWSRLQRGYATTSDNDNYFTCTKALDYYRKAALSDDREVAALSNLMIYKCMYLVADKQLNRKNRSYLKKFYEYDDTKIFGIAHCPLLDSYMKARL